MYNVLTGSTLLQLMTGVAFQVMLGLEVLIVSMISLCKERFGKSTEPLNSWPITVCSLLRLCSCFRRLIKFQTLIWLTFYVVSFFTLSPRLLLTWKTEGIGSSVRGYYLLLRSRFVKRLTVSASHTSGRQFSISLRRAS